ncbi:MAG TPA: YidC/Oxa1 family membrane protein insertase [Sphingobacteriaceae bacterium]|nr:YidC/Oxa1 family membrane protein insertase [Sphingobacteriaceae bacterium]
MWEAFIGFLASAMESLYNYTGNYGLAIIILTVAIRLVLMPLTITQMRSMRRMQALQPEMERLQKKYGDDKERLNREIMELWQKHKVNPMSGCLPLLVQMPILFGFFQTINRMEFGAQADFLWIGNLANPDPFILPILAGLTTFWQTRVTTPSTGDPTQKIMLYVMPVFFAWISRSFPAGVALYWVVQNLFGVAQQYAVNRLDRQGVKEETN